MMTDHRRTEALVKAAPTASFVELVHAIERTHSGGAIVGGAGPAAEEPVRFRHDPSLSFPSGDVSHATTSPSASSTDQIALTATFLGLTGSASPLPSYLAEEVLQEDPEQPVQRDFLDLFHHRLLGLLYRGLIGQRYPETFRSGGTDELSARFLCLAGVDQLASEQASLLPRPLLLRLSALLSIHRPTVEALTKALQIAFDDLLEGGRVGVEPLAGGQVLIAGSQQMRLGVNSRLQRAGGMPLGTRVLCASSKLRVHMGPLSRASYDKLRTPTQLELLRNLVAVFSQQAIDCELVVGLRADATCVWRLGTGAPAEVGRNTWLATTASTPLQHIKLQLPAC